MNSPDQNPDHSKLNARVSSLETEVRNIAGEVNAVHGLLEDVRKQIIATQRTQWGPVFAGASIIITIIGMFLLGYGRNQDRIEATLTKLTDSYISHTQTEGHPALIQRVSALEDGNKNLDTTLQREMRLLDETGAAERVALDVRLQREMELLDKNILIQVVDNRRRLDKLETIE